MFLRKGIMNKQLTFCAHAATLDFELWKLNYFANELFLCCCILDLKSFCILPCFYACRLVCTSPFTPLLVKIHYQKLATL